MQLKSLFLFLGILILISSCRENIEDFDSTTTIPQPPITRIVTGDVSGRIINEAGQAISGVQISLGNELAISDEKGLFVIENVDMNAGGSLVSATKIGYFNGSRRFFPAQDQTSFVTITMLETTPAGTFDAVAGGTVSASMGGEVSFPPQAVMTATGLPYEGPVTVSARWLNPTATNLGEIMPGNLQGLDDSGQEVALGSFGMMAVELTDPSGTPLQVADGQTATLSFPVPASLVSGAPADIPLWSFDEASGMWIEEGIATLQGNVYVGEVSHFSFWNCDVPFPLIELSGSVQDANGTGLSGLTIRITAPSFGGPNVGYGWTNDSGVFAGKVPAGEELLVEVIGQCGVLYSESFGPFSDDADVGVLMPDPDNVLIADISGTLVDCDGNPVASGIVVVEYDNTSRAYVVEDGDIDGAIITCEPTTEITITGYDPATSSQSDPVTLPYDENLDYGALEACDAIQGEFFTITVDGYAPMLIPDPIPVALQDSVISGPSGPFGPPQMGTLITGYIDSLSQITLITEGIGVGVYPASDVQTFNFFNYQQGFIGVCTQCFEIEFTSYGDVGEYIEGSFSGEIPFEILNGGGVEFLNTTGSFRILREQ